MDPTTPLLEEMRTESARLKSLLEKTDLKQEDLASADAIKNKLLDLRNKVDTINKTAALKTDLADQDAWLNDPVRQTPFGIDHRYESGETVTEYNRRTGQREIVFENGEGIFGVKAFKAICQPEYKDAFKEYLRKPLSKMSAKSLKTLEEGVDDQGGYLSPIDLQNRIVERKPTPTRVAGFVENLTTSREFVEMLKLNYATDNIYSTAFRVTKTGEQATSVTAAQVTDTSLFGVIKIPVHTFMIRGLLTLNMIEDSAFDPLSWLTGKFNETVDILHDDKTLNGTGRQEPTGILSYNAASANGGGLDDPLISYIPSGDPALITADSIKLLNTDVPEQYDENCRYLFNKTSTYKALKLLKDLDDRYLFSGIGVMDDGLGSGGRPSMLDGYPYAWSGLMPNVGAGNFPIIFGDFKGYTKVNRIGFSVQVLRELYAELGQVSVVGRVRFGGQVLEPWRFRLLKVGVS